MAGTGPVAGAPAGPGAAADPVVVEVATPGPSGWRRVLIATILGVLAGTLVALLLPRDDGPKRTRSFDSPPAGAEPPPAESVTAPPDRDDGSRRP